MELNQFFTKARWIISGKKLLSPTRSWIPAAYGELFSWVEMLSNFALRLVPIPLTVAMITTEIPAAIRPYSIAVAPRLVLRNATSLSM